MSFPFQYDHGIPQVFGGAMPVMRSFDDSAAVVLPVPFERTTSYGGGTRGGPHAILEASSHMELWDEEVGIDIHGVGIFTLPEMEFPLGELKPTMDEIERVAHEVLSRGKFLVALGGEHSITPPIVAAAARVHSHLAVLQIDAHADLRESYMGTPYSHACAIYASLPHAAVTQVGIRSMSTEEAGAAASLGTRIFYDWSMRQDPNWIDRVVESLGDRPVYITIDVDGLDPAIMPSTGTPEPGGLTWYETIGLLRATMRQRTVVGCDVVELSPIPGLHAPNFLCAKLVYKLLTYRFAGR
jgi:agmatinase